MNEFDAAPRAQVKILGQRGLPYLKPDTIYTAVQLTGFDDMELDKWIVMLGNEADEGVNMYATDLIFLE